MQQPGRPSRWRPLPAVAAALVLLVLLILPLPDTGRIGEALLDLLHGPAFALLGFLGCEAVRSRRHGSTVLAVVTVSLLVSAFGIGAEYAQTLVDRHASWHDAAANGLGAAAGALWSLGRSSPDRPARFGLILASLLLLTVAAWGPVGILIDSYRQSREMPMLASFEHELELSRWSVREGRMHRVQEHATAGAWSLRLELDRGRYPGAALRCPPTDWSLYSELVFDLRVDEGAELDLIVKVEDVEHSGERDDRFEQRIRLGPGRRRVVIPLAEIEAGPRSRRLDLRHVAFVQLFTVRPRQRRTLYLDNVHLR